MPSAVSPIAFLDHSLPGPDPSRQMDEGQQRDPSLSVSTLSCQRRHISTSSSSFACTNSFNRWYSALRVVSVMRERLAHGARGHCTYKLDITYLHSLM